MKVYKGKGKAWGRGKRVELRRFGSGQTGGKLNLKTFGSSQGTLKKHV